MIATPADLRNQLQALGAWEVVDLVGRSAIAHNGDMGAIEADIDKLSADDFARTVRGEA